MRMGLVLGLVTAVLAASAAAAVEKVALLIGNADYQHANRLENPINDVDALAESLRAIGFSVDVRNNLNRAALGDALLNFGQKARAADTALIFFSGHGMEIGGDNYLIPTDARLRRPGSERVEAIPLSLAVDATEGAERLSVVIVDACRNGAPGASRSGVSKGFRPVKARPGLAIAFSTAPGEPAWDGTGRMSPYTRALTEAIAADADTDVRLLFTSLGGETARYAGADQRPFARFGDMPRRGIVSLSGGAVAASAPEDDLSDLGAHVADALRRGDLVELFQLGWNLENGANGAPKDFAAALRLYAAACDRGGAEGCRGLGWMHDNGFGVAQDPRRAATFYGQACQGGDGAGCTNLGFLHEKGSGMAADMGEAVRLYRRGCALESAHGCHNLGVMYEAGLGVDRDRAEAIASYRKALGLLPDYAAPQERLRNLGETP